MRAGLMAYSKAFSHAKFVRENSSMFHDSQRSEIASQYIEPQERRFEIAKPIKTAIPNRRFLK